MYKVLLFSLSLGQQAIALPYIKRDGLREHLCFKPREMNMRVPSSVQTISAVVSDLTLYKAADIADRILEVSPSNIETCAVSNKKGKNIRI
ncbi:hypothetical protein TNCV_1236831 [Trichonephila clavipes]|nr:hypothetical protein TNCV_1236831 [Trichonephila clavipes]